MGNVKKTRPQRSLTRRLFAPLALVALLSAGGWGAYQYYLSPQGDEAATNDKNVAAHSAPAAKDELKLLFGADNKSEQVPSTAAKFATTGNKLPAKQDRYAQTKVTPTKLPLATAELPQLDTAKSLPPIVNQNEEKTSELPTRQSLLGDRYATALTTPVSTQNMPAAQDQTAEADVTRGQDPSGNPLRTPNKTTTANDQDAKAAFSAALNQPPKTAAQTPQPTTNPFAAKPAKDNAENNLSNALQNARPLTPRQPVPPPSNDRYQIASSAPSLPPSAPQPEQPAPPLEVQLPASLENQPRPTSPLGAPPAALQAVRQPAPVTPELAAPPAMPTLAASAPATLTPPVMAPTPTPGLTPTPGIANHPGTGRPGERLLEGAQSPSITIQKLAPEEIQVNKRCTFAIRVHNSGQRTAQNVQIRDEVPLGTELVGTAPRATVSGSEVIWDLGTLSPGEERTVEMELLPQEEGEIGSVATVSISAQASAKSRCTRPVLALRLTSGPKVHVGEQHVVQIEVSNPGSGDATGVMLLETVPTGVSHEAGPALEFEVGTLRPGENRRLELILTAEQAGRINNVMTARADANLQVEASCEFEVIAPELQLSVEGPQRRFLERPATYQVSINNPGTASAKDVQLVTHLPQGMQFVSADKYGEYDASTHSVHWSLAELPANEHGTVELVALPIEAGEQTLKIATKAQQGLEDRTDKQVMVEGLSALMFEVVDVESLIEIGKETTYEIRVQNKGSKAATNVQVAALLPAGMQPITGRGETRHAIQGDRVIFAPLPQLAPKSDTTFYIQARGVRSGDQLVRVQITDDDLQKPIVKEVNTRVYADE